MAHNPYTNLESPQVWDEIWVIYIYIWFINHLLTFWNELKRSGLHSRVENSARLAAAWPPLAAGHPTFWRWIWLIGSAFDHWTISGQESVVVCFVLERWPTCLLQKWKSILVATLVFLHGQTLQKMLSQVIFIGWVRSTMPSSIPHKWHPT